MPSPFPGMDPFLEHPAIFPDLHDSLVTYISESLQTHLPQPYYSVINSRVWVTVPHDEFRETYVQITEYDGDSGNERIVTTIEVLSWTNKTPGEHGRDLYRRKQREILDSQVHLVEIDLLRGGEHTTAVPLNRARKKTGPFDYHVCIHHFDNLEDYFVYPIRLDERLPEIQVPLLPGDGAVAIDLQTVFDRCYDTGPYTRRVRYRELTLVPPLRPEHAEWTARLLKEKLSAV